jgi:hypothetical protein
VSIFSWILSKEESCIRIFTRKIAILSQNMMLDSTPLVSQKVWASCTEEDMFTATVSLFLEGFCFFVFAGLVC